MMPRSWRHPAARSPAAAGHAAAREQAAASPDGVTDGASPAGRRIYESDDRPAPDTRDGLRDWGAQHDLLAPGFPVDRWLRGAGEVSTTTSTRR
jgi:hypothetical protein